MADYTKDLSFHAGLGAEFPGFSASASIDYSSSQKENLANSFTRISYIVNLFTISLPPLAQTRSLLKTSFIKDLEEREPIDFYREYGTHLLRSLVIGGRAAFLASTDTLSYSSTTSLSTAAKISASYGVSSGSVELTASEKEAMNSFNESSEIKVSTSEYMNALNTLDRKYMLMSCSEGGHPRYGNENFLGSVQDWVDSVFDYPE
jgi:hypothetical protein